MLGRYLPSVGLGIVLAGSIALGQTAALGQTSALGQTGASGQTGPAVTAQNMLSASAAASSAGASATATDTPVQPGIDMDDNAMDPASLLPDLAALPSSKASLIGGTVQKLDRVKDEITVQVFGGGKMKIAFDSRTNIYRGSAQVATADLRQGDRVYVDTILNGTTVFARNIRLKGTGAVSAGESQGVVVSYRSDKGELELRDALSPQPLKIHLTPQTQVIQDGHAASLGELTAGTLVAVRFGAQQNGDVASEVSVLATPGSSFTFGGMVTGLDLRLGLLTITSSTDHKNYEISIDPAVVSFDDTLRPGVDVTAVTRFDGARYVARSLTVNSH
jgi:hypothetical protein